MVLDSKRKHSVRNGIWAGWPYLIVLLISFLIGALVGTAFAIFIEPSSGLSDYLHEYCTLLSRNEVQISFFSAVLDCIQWPLMTLVLGATALGIAGIPLLFVVRGFLLSFATCTFGLILGQRGVAVAAVLFSTSVVFVLPVLFVLGCDGLRGACMRLPGAIPTAAKLYRLEMLLICLGVLAVSVAVQWTVIPAGLSAFCSRLAF